MSQKPLLERDYRFVENLFLTNTAKIIKTGVYTTNNTFTPPSITQTIFAANILNAANTRKILKQSSTPQLAALSASSYNNDEIPASKADNNAAPATPQNIIFKRVENETGQMIAECEKYSGSNSYITFLVENHPLPSGITINKNGNIIIPAELTIPIIINVTAQSKKLFEGLNIGSTYYLYYAVINSNGASGISVGKSMLCG